MIIHRSHVFPRGGHNPHNRFEILAEDSDVDSTWSFETGADELLHLIESMDSEDEFTECNEERPETAEAADWLISCYGKGFSYYDVGLHNQLFFTDYELLASFCEEDALSEINSVQETFSSISICFGAADTGKDVLGDQLLKIASFQSFLLSRVEELSVGLRPLRAKESRSTSLWESSRTGAMAWMTGMMMMPC